MTLYSQTATPHLIRRTPRFIVRVMNRKVQGAETTNHENSREKNTSGRSTTIV